MPTIQESCDTCLSHVSTQAYCERAFEIANLTQEGLNNTRQQLGVTVMQSINENVIDTLRWRLMQISCSLDDQQIISRVQRD
jgi:hypothetical protein